MPYGRGRFFLTPPSVPVFVVSLALAIVAFLIYYARVQVPIVNPGRVFDVLAIAYVIMLAGVLIRRI